MPLHIFKKEHYSPSHCKQPKEYIDVDLSELPTMLEEPVPEAPIDSERRKARDKMKEAEAFQSRLVRKLAGNVIGATVNLEHPLGRGQVTDAQIAATLDTLSAVHGVETAIHTPKPAEDDEANRRDNIIRPRTVTITGVTDVANIQPGRHRAR